MTALQNESRTEVWARIFPTSSYAIGGKLSCFPCQELSDIAFDFQVQSWKSCPHC